MNETQVIGGRYELVGFIGEGGMGAVYRGLDTQTGDVVAVKSLKPDVVRLDDGMIERFEREGDALRRLNHPNIVKVFSTVEGDDGSHYIIMEYVTGGSLRDVLDKHPQLPVSRVLDIALDLSDALTRAHRLNIIHRDIKPANILIADDGTPRLTDFGVAQMGDSPRMTQAGALVGTLVYLSPEGAQGEEVDERTDIWSFGMVLYEMLAGRNPFEKGQIVATLHAIVTQPPPDLEEIRPDVPVALADLIYRMLEKDRHARIPSVRLVGAELEAIMRGHDSTLNSRSLDSTRFGTPPPLVVDITPSKLKPPNNLPAQTTPFVGRDTELDEISRLIADPTIRLITVAGPGGMGKTRITIEAARLILDGTSSTTSGSRSTLKLPTFANGVFFVPLAPLESVDFIVSTIAESVNFSFYSSDDPKTQLLNYLREKEILLVMDNFEHLMGGVGIVADILKTAPDVKILVSSRERLRLQGETIYDLQGMRFPEYETPAELENYAAVKLFLQSARRVQPEFELNEATAPLIAKICRLVQGMPLGIELAAAWLEILQAHEIVAEIERSYDFLETDLRDVPDRHRSMRAVFEYSWNLMSPAEQQVFMKLSVFRGGFTREAAQAVSDAGLRELTGLVNKSLLRRSPEGRYEVHELLRQYAEEHLKNSADNDSTHMRHCQYFMDNLRTYEPDILSRNQKRVLESVEADFDNIRAAWHYATDKGEVDLIGNATHTLGYVYDILSMFQEGHDRMKHTKEAFERQGIPDDNVALARVRNHYGSLVGRLGNYPLNREMAENALSVFRKSGTKVDIIYALNSVSYVAMIEGSYEESKQLGNEAWELARQINDRPRQFLSLGNVGYAAFLAGEYEDAKNMYEEGVRITDESDVPVGRAYSRNNLGEIVQALGDYARAKQLYEEAYTIFKALGNRRGVAFTLNNLGNIAQRMEDLPESHRRFEEALALYREIGDRNGLGIALQNLGYTEWSMGDNDSAKRHFEESLTIRREIGDRRGVADALINLGNTLQTMRNYKDCQKSYEESLAVSREINYRPGIASALYHLGQNLWFIGDLQQSKAYFQEAVALHRGIGDPFELGLSMTLLAQTHDFLGEYEEARAIAEESITFNRSVNNMWGIGAGMLSLAQAAWGLGDKQTAIDAIYEFLPHVTTLQIDNALAGLVVLAMILDGTGQLELATQVIGFTTNHPDFGLVSDIKAIDGLMQQGLKDIQAKLSSDVYASALARGKAYSTQELVDTVLRQRG